MDSIAYLWSYYLQYVVELQLRHTICGESKLLLCHLSNVYSSPINVTVADSGEIAPEISPCGLSTTDVKP